MNQVGEIIVHEWNPWHVLLANDDEQASEIILHPCKTCFKVCRFLPTALQVLQPDMVGGVQPVDDAETRQRSIRSLYQLFDIDMPLLTRPEPTPGVQSYSSGVNQQERLDSMEPCAWADLPLLERPFLPSQQSAPKKARTIYELRGESQYVPPDVGLDQIQDENRPDGTLAGMYTPMGYSEREFPECRLGSNYKREHTPSEHEQSDIRKRRCTEKRAGGADPKPTTLRWWERINPWLQSRDLPHHTDQSTWHECEHEWRNPDATLPKLVTELYEGMSDQFSMPQVALLAGRGDEIVDQMNGLYPALCAVQEQEMRKVQPQIDFVTSHRDLFEHCADELIDVLRTGVRAVYGGHPPIPPRRRGLPYKMKDSETTTLILSKLWKDIFKRRMFLCTTRTVKLNELIEATPTTTVEKKNPDRSISKDRRVIADLRRVNLKFDTCQYYPIEAPSVHDIARWILALTHRYPGLDLKLTKRDVASAFRLLRLHPALSLVMVTEFPANHVLLDDDLVCVFGYAVRLEWGTSPFRPVWGCYHTSTQSMWVGTCHDYPRETRFYVCTVRG